MSRLEELPPDQRAALSLLLRQRKSYAEVADMLHIPARAVHDRAHAALAVLAPREARALDPQRRLELGDYLLGQQASASERLRTRTLLGDSEPARSWANAVAAELAPLAGSGQLPEIPPAGPSSHGIGRAGTTQRGVSAPSSRVGGALILAAIVVAVAVTVVLLTTGGKGDKPHHHHGSRTNASSKGKELGVHKILLHAPRAGKQVGVVAILTEGGKRAFYIEADNLPMSKGFFYAIWLYNSPTNAKALSRAPAVGKTHRLAGGALLPTNAGRYKEILLTRETKKVPKHPGPIVLEGTFSL